jgi:hypothetical protein
MPPKEAFGFATSGGQQSATTHGQRMQPEPEQGQPAPPAWSKEDNEILLRARQEGRNWAEIQRLYFPTKTSNACRKHHERLKVQQDQGDWDLQKMERLAREYIQARKEMWQRLADRMGGGEKWTVIEAKVSC